MAHTYEMTRMTVKEAKLKFNAYLAHRWNKKVDLNLDKRQAEIAMKKDIPTPIE